jgi:hypothetical protein
MQTRNKPRHRAGIMPYHIRGKRFSRTMALC